MSVGRKEHPGMHLTSKRLSARGSLGLVINVERTASDAMVNDLYVLLAIRSRERVAGRSPARSEESCLTTSARSS